MSYLIPKSIKNQRGNSEYILKSYAIDDRFTADIERYNCHEGLTRICMELSVDEAAVLKERLEQFIRMNQVKRG